MQTCFFAISDILPREQAIAAIKQAVDKTYGKKSKRLAELNHRAIDMTLAHLHQVPSWTRGHSRAATQPPPAPLGNGGVSASPPSSDVTLPIYAGLGDCLRYRPCRKTVPGGRHGEIRETQHRLEIGMGRALCTQCGKCVFVCPIPPSAPPFVAATTTVRRKPSSTSRPRARISRPAPT